MYVQDATSTKEKAVHTRTLAFIGLILMLAVAPAVHCAAATQSTDFYTPQVLSCSNRNAPTQPIDSFSVKPINRSIRYPVPSCAKDLPTQPNGIGLDIKLQKQTVDYVTGMSDLCWASDISMISTHLGNARVPCQVASYEAGDEKSCCRLSLSSPAADIARCNQSGDLSPVLNRMGIYHVHQVGVLTEEEIQHEISNGRPIVPHLAIDGVYDGKHLTVYHVIVISGYAGGSYQVLDSGHDSPETLTYQELLHGPKWQWAWINTWYHFSYRIDGCNPRFRNDCDCQ